MLFGTCMIYKNRENFKQIAIQVKTTSYKKKEWTLGKKNEDLIDDNIVGNKVIVDPPRTGLDSHTIDVLNKILLPCIKSKCSFCSNNTFLLSARKIACVFLHKSSNSL